MVGAGLTLIRALGDPGRADRVEAVGAGRSATMRARHRARPVVLTGDLQAPEGVSHRVHGDGALRRGRRMLDIRAAAAGARCLRSRLELRRQDQVGDVVSHRRRLDHRRHRPAMLIFIVPMFESMYNDLGGTLPVADADPDRVSAFFTRSGGCRHHHRRASCSSVTREAGHHATGGWRWDRFKLRLPIARCDRAEDSARPLLSALWRRWPIRRADHGGA